MKNVIESIKSKYPVSNGAIELLTSYFEEQIFPAKTHIIKANVFDRNVFFIESGVTRSYILVDGKEITNWFSKEGDVTCGSLDLFRNRAGFEYVQTLETTKTYSIPISILNELYRTNIEIANWARVLNQDIFLLMQDLRIERLTLSAKERYNKLVRDFLNLCNRVNLGYIASYLGITLPTLSKLRAEI
jgi:CRP-like cAMP-binding protein